MFMLIHGLKALLLKSLKVPLMNRLALICEGPQNGVLISIYVMSSSYSICKRFTSNSPKSCWSKTPKSSDCRSQVRSLTTTGTFDDQWKTRVENDVQTLIEQEYDKILATNYIPTEQYNQEITNLDVHTALKEMNSDASPGPDGILPVMLIKAQATCIPHLQYLFNMCFDVGRVPSPWKHDNRIYLPKPGKTDYHVEKAYRPLSLNSVTGKAYEHTMAKRFICYLYSQFCIDKYNFAYKKHSSTLHALLYMINSIKEGFREDKVTAAIFIDLEGAFDAIWRDGLIYKVADIGVRGNLLLYIVDFLRGRKSRSLVNTYTSEWTSTDIGVPQGSIIAPILFVHYIKDLTTTLPSNVKYADDVSAWVTDIDATQAATDLQNQLVGLNNWLHKWRLQISSHKTETVLFCKRGPSRPIQVYLNGNPLDCLVWTLIITSSLTSTQT